MSFELKPWYEFEWIFFCSSALPESVQYGSWRRVLKKKNAGHPPTHIRYISAICNYRYYFLQFKSMSFFSTLCQITMERVFRIHTKKEQGENWNDSMKWKKKCVFHLQWNDTVLVYTHTGWLNSKNEAFASTIKMFDWCMQLLAFLVTQ